ncbi:hypothetical protein HYX18_03420 [Candidatus Woesearchaeota archaeon]|nr:hypothetical protein [Candidatus Woesearchaeota archaeon]
MKKAQGSSIMVFLILLALFIVLYVLLLPPAAREELLDLNVTDSSGIGIGSKANTLLYEIPGIIVAEEDNEIEHKMDSVNLFVKSEPIIKVLSNSIEVERSSFGKQDQNLLFNADSLSNLQSALLTFTVLDSRGSLIISLNGQNIYEKSVKKGTQEIIQLPKDLLTEKNELKFSVSSPGILFFIKNRYFLKDIRLKEELEKINSKETRVFSISNTEQDNLDSSRLDYFVFCNSLDEPATSLKVYLNDQLVTSQVVSCGGGERGIDLDVEDIKQGQNELLFVIDSGDFTISQIKLTNKLKRGIFNVYEFDISRKDFDEVLKQNKKVLLVMTFADKTSVKRGKILINDDQISLDTTSDKFAKDISKSVTDGINKLRIVPDKELAINTLRITFETA